MIKYLYIPCAGRCSVYPKWSAVCDYGANEDIRNGYKARTTDGGKLDLEAVELIKQMRQHLGTLCEQLVKATVVIEWCIYDKAEKQWYAEALVSEILRRPLSEQAQLGKAWYERRKGP